MSERNENGHFAKGNKVGPRFPKGTSGCPGGRGKHAKEARELALQETEASFRVLIQIRDNTDEDSRARIAACKEIIRYGIGEPKAPDEAPPKDGDMGALTLDELRNLARQSLAEEAAGEADDADDDSDETEPH